MAEAGALAQARQVFIEGCGLPAAWAGQAQWRVLETGFGAGLNFLASWHAWQGDPHRPRLLHYVAITPAAVSADDVGRDARASPGLQPLADALTHQLEGLTPGFHRLSLEHGRVLLTLCVGEPQAMLRAQAFTADSVYLSGPALQAAASSRDAAPLGKAPRDLAMLKAVARCCRRGTTLAAGALSDEAQRGLAQCGFRPDDTAGKSRAAHRQRLVFDPAWTLRRPEPPPAALPARAAVIGAGLAGAAVAASLARRGWQVRVLDAAATPASGASGLPAGLLAPHTSPDDNQLSRLTRAGVRMTLQQASELLAPGTDWQRCGVLQQRLEDARALPDLGDAGVPWQRLAATMNWPVRHAQPHAVWHELAAWVKPAALVAAWLAQEGITLQAPGRVQALRHNEGVWHLMDDAGAELAQAELVVVAAAMASAALLPPGGRPELTAVRGQVSWALQPTPMPPGWPAHALNGHGHFIPSVPVAGGEAWLCGATYDRNDADTAMRDTDHQANLHKLQGLAPALAEQLAAPFNQREVNAWTGVRCTATDRRPLLGEVGPALWLATALGSRGLTFAPLCAELLAARLHGEPLPLPRELADALAASRAL